MTHTERRILGRYELIEPLGRGVATETFRAKSFGVEGFQKTIAVKRVLPDVAAAPEFVAAFLEHVPRAMRLSHQNLAQVIDVGKVEEPTGPTYFVATEFVAGLDVATLLERVRHAGQELPLALGVYLTLEVAKALDHAHRRRDEQLRPLSVLHGAVAPHSVMISFDGDVKVTDFGLTRALLTLSRGRGLLRRVHAAESPEQAAGAAPSVAGDVFSLGSFLYAVVSGAPPFIAESVEETRRNVVRAGLPSLAAVRQDVPREVADLARRALAVDPGERFTSVSALHEELLAITYACGLRTGASELSAFVDRFREAPVTVPGERVDVLLSRPLSMPPPSPDEVRAPEPEERDLPRPTSVPPLTGFGDLRHVSVLAFVQEGEPGDPEARAARISSIVERYGGVMSSMDAQGGIAFFGLDHGDGRDTELAARAGLVLVRSFADLGSAAGEGKAGVGIDSGRLRWGPDGPVDGDPRTLVLRSDARALASEATSEVLVSRRASSSLRGRFPLEPSGSGIRVLEFAQDRFVDSFVGRKDELRKLGEMLVRAARGELRLVRVTGEAGIGKTRLAIEMQRRLARGSIEIGAHFATCPPRGRELPESGLVAMLRRVCGVHDGDPPHLVEALAPRLRALGMSADEASAVMAGLGGAAPRRYSQATSLRGAFTKLLHSLSEDRFTVFVWDDAHELDAASCDVVARAVDRLGGSRLALVLSGRADAGAPFTALPAHGEVFVGDLPEEDVERLIAERAGVTRAPEGLVQFLRERAGGQPLFVEELVRQMVEGRRLVTSGGEVTELRLDETFELPRSLRALTADRLRRLTDDERHLFVAAAVLEPPAALPVLARMVELPVAAVEQVAEALVSRGLLTRDGQQALGFASPLAREVVLAELDQEDKESLHRRAAIALRECLGDRLDEQADEVGYHLASAGERGAAAEYYARSGLHCLTERQLERAAQGLAYALGLADLEPANAEQIASWLRALSSAVRHVRTGPSLPALLERLSERLGGAEHDPLVVARMRIDLASILGGLGDELAGEALLDGTAAEARVRPDLATALLTAYAELASGRGDFRAARRALDPLARMSVTDGGELHRVTLAMARTLSAAGKHEAALSAVQDAERGVSPDDPLLSLDRASVRTSIQMAQGALRDAAESAMAAASQAEELGLVYEVASSLCDQAVAFARLGDVARARAAAASALSAAEEAGGERVLLRARLVQGYLDATDEAELHTLREHLAREESRGWLADALLGRYLLARVASRLGDPAAARAELGLASRIASKAGNSVMAELCDAELAALGV